MGIFYSRSAAPAATSDINDAATTLIRVRMLQTPDNVSTSAEIELPTSATASVDELKQYIEGLPFFPADHHFQSGSLLLQSAHGESNENSLIEGLDEAWCARRRAVLSFVAEEDGAEAADEKKRNDEEDAVTTLGFANCSGDGDEDIERSGGEKELSNGIVHANHTWGKPGKKTPGSKSSIKDDTTPEVPDSLIDSELLKSHISETPSTTQSPSSKVAFIKPGQITNSATPATDQNIEPDLPHSTTRRGGINNNNNNNFTESIFEKARRARRNQHRAAPLGPEAEADAARHEARRATLQQTLNKSLSAHRRHFDPTAPRAQELTPPPSSPMMGLATVANPAFNTSNVEQQKLTSMGCAHSNKANGGNAASAPALSHVTQLERAFAPSKGKKMEEGAFGEDQGDLSEEL